MMAFLRARSRVHRAGRGCAGSCSLYACRVGFINQVITAANHMRRKRILGDRRRETTTTTANKPLDGGTRRVKEIPACTSDGHFCGGGEGGADITATLTPCTTSLTRDCTRLSLPASVLARRRLVCEGRIEPPARVRGHRQNAVVVAAQSSSSSGTVASWPANDFLVAAPGIHLWPLFTLSPSRRSRCPAFIARRPPRPRRTTTSPSSGPSSASRISPATRSTKTPRRRSRSPLRPPLDGSSSTRAYSTRHRHRHPLHKLPFVTRKNLPQCPHPPALSASPSQPARTAPGRSASQRPRTTPASTPSTSTVRLALCSSTVISPIAHSAYPQHHPHPQRLRDPRPARQASRRAPQRVAPEASH